MVGREKTMPTVVALWRGQCHEHLLQEELCTRIAELGEISHWLYQEFFQKEVKAVWYDGQPLSGAVKISESVFHDRHVPQELESLEKGIYPSLNLRLYGCQYVLFDPRQYNSPLTMSNDYDLSFVFLRSEDRNLDGWLVKIQKEPDRDRDVDDYMLVVPKIDLRYYLENWMGGFLGWVKHFYVPNLYYWIWEDYPGYSFYKEFDKQDIRLRNEIFSQLLKSFQEEAKRNKADTLEYLKRRKPEPDNEIYARIIISPGTGDKKSKG